MNNENMNTLVRESRNAEERKGFRIHAIVTVCIVPLLALINLMVSPEFLWFLFPMAGMSLGLAFHYYGMRRGYRG